MFRLLIVALNKTQTWKDEAIAQRDKAIEELQRVKAELLALDIAQHNASSSLNKAAANSSSTTTTTTSNNDPLMIECNRLGEKLKAIEESRATLEVNRNNDFFFNRSNRTEKENRLVEGIVSVSRYIVTE